MTRYRQELQSDEATFFLRDDNTVERILADGDVEGDFRGTSNARSGVPIMPNMTLAGDAKSADPGSTDRQRPAGD